MLRKCQKQKLYFRPLLLTALQCQQVLEAYRLISKHFFQRTQQHGGSKKALDNNELVEKVMSYSYHMEEKTFVETSCTNNIILWKSFVQLLLLKVCETFPFRQSWKLVVYLGLYESSLYYQRGEDQINIIYEVLHMQIFSLM